MSDRLIKITTTLAVAAVAALAAVTSSHRSAPADKEAGTPCRCTPSSLKGTRARAVPADSRYCGASQRAQCPFTQLRRVSAHRLRNNWVMPATIAVARTQPRMIISQV